MISIQHASPIPVPADWVEIPSDRDVGPFADLILQDGRIAHAWRTGSAGRQTIFYHALVSDFGEEVVQGKLFPTKDQRTPWDELPPHPSAVRFDVDIEDFVGVAPGKFVEDGGDLVVRVSPRFLPLHPIIEVDITLQRFSLVEDGGPVDIEIDFGPGATVVIPPESAGFLDLSEGPTKRTLTVAPSGLDWGTRPTYTVRVFYDGPNSFFDGPLKAAAAFGAPRATCRPQRWFPLGVVPRTDYLVEEFFRSELLQWDLDEQKNYDDRRPFSQALVAGNAGSQRFGTSFDGVIFSLPPVEAYRIMRIAAEDELLRPVHWLDDDGELATAADFPCTKTDLRVPFAPHSPNSDLEEVIGGWPPRTTPHGGRTADDDEHTDDLGLFAYLALVGRGSKPFWDCLDQIMEREAADSRLHSGNIEQTRGVGRSRSTIAKACWLRPENEAWKFVLSTFWTHVGRMAEWNKASAGPLKPIKTIGPDLRILNGQRRGFMLYEHATVVQALVESAHVLDGGERIACLAAARTIAETILRLACDGEDPWPKWLAYVVGVPHVGSGHDGHATGEMPPPGFETIGTPTHASWVNGSPGRGWTRWAGRAAYLLLYLDDLEGVDSAQAETARKIVEALESNLPESLGQRAEQFRMTAAPTMREEAPLDS
jgi:hypothetical protein